MSLFHYNRGRNSYWKQTKQATFDWIFGIKLRAKIFNDKQKLIILYSYSKEKTVVRGNKTTKANVMYEIELDSIDCIHTAITSISAEDLVSNNDMEAANLFENTLKIRSSENLREINLVLEEKFKAFKSWVSGIAEAGLEAIHIQREIEEYGHLMYPISNRLFKALIRVKPEFLIEYVDMLLMDCVFESKMHVNSFYANFVFVLKSITNLKSRVDIFKYVFNHEEIDCKDKDIIHGRLLDERWLKGDSYTVMNEIYEFGYVTSERIKDNLMFKSILNGV